MAREAVKGNFLRKEFSNLDERRLFSRKYLMQFATSEKLAACFARSPLVLLPDEVLFGEVDQVDHRLRGDEEMFVQHFNLQAQLETHYG